MHKTNLTKVIKEKDQNIFLSPLQQSLVMQFRLALISCLYLSNTGITDVHHAWLEGLNYIIVIWKFPSDEINRQFPKEEKQMPSKDS